MLLKYIEIGCKNLLKSREVFLSNYAFSMVSELKDSCVLRNNSIELHLTQQQVDINRVVNVGFSHDNIFHFKDKASRLGLRTSEVSDNCKHNQGTPYVSVQSPYSHLTHNVYQRLDKEPERVTTCSSIKLDIDHVLFCCDAGTAHSHARWYADMLDLRPYSCEGSESGAMKVIVNGSGMRMFVNEGGAMPIFAFSEPITSSNTGYNQIERFLKANNGGGVQHIALKTDNIFNTVQQLQNNGVRVIQQPSSYYALEEKQRQFADLDLDPRIAYENSIIIDQDKDGYLLQVFTESLFDKDGMFLEIIERRGSRGFGTGNVKALFAALQEKMQASS